MSLGQIRDLFPIVLTMKLAKVLPHCLPQPSPFLLILIGVVILQIDESILARAVNIRIRHILTRQGNVIFTQSSSLCSVGDRLIRRKHTALAVLCSAWSRVLLVGQSDS